MISLKSLISEQKNRSVKLNASSQVMSKLINSKCKTSKNLFADGLVFYRGINLNANFYNIDPSKTIRIPNQQSRLAHFLLDLLPSWENWPKRSRSVIFTNNKDQASEYGNLYIVLPTDGAEIAICPKMDFWDSFSYVKKRIRVDGIPDFNVFFSSNFFPVVYGIEIKNINNSNQIKNIFKNLDVNVKSTDDVRNKIIKKINFIPPNYTLLLKDMERENFDGDLIKYFDGLLNPQRNGFELVKIESMNAKFLYGKYKEMFTESKCVLVNELLI